MDTPQTPTPPQTTFARMIAEHPLESEAHEVLLAHMLAHIVCDDGRTPTLNERAFIDRFTPRVETPIDDLAKRDMPREGLNELDVERKETIMAIALVVAMLDANGGVPNAVVLRVAEAIELPIERLAACERVAREHIVEQRFERLYAHGKPEDAEREAAFESLRAIGASDSLLMAWDERASTRAAARPVEEQGARHAKRRHADFMSRHDPTSSDHRVSSAVGVFGSK